RTIPSEWVGLAECEHPPSAHERALSGWMGPGGRGRRDRALAGRRRGARDRGLRRREDEIPWLDDRGAKEDPDQEGQDGDRSRDAARTDGLDADLVSVFVHGNPPDDARERVASNLPEVGTPHIRVRREDLGLVSE